MSKRLNRDDIDKFHDYGIYIPKRTVYVGSIEADIQHGESGTDAALAEFTIKNLLILEAMSAEPITVIMNNFGGDETHGLAIYDAIKQCKSHVTIQVLGSAESMGSIILQAADERIMSPTSIQMLHYGEWSFSGHAKTGSKHAAQADKMNDWMEQMYLDKIKLKHPDFTLNRLKKMLDHDTFLSATEAVELGLADKVSGEDND